MAQIHVFKKKDEKGVDLKSKTSLETSLVV